MVVHNSEQGRIQRFCKGGARSGWTLVSAKFYVNSFFGKKGSQISTEMGGRAPLSPHPKSVPGETIIFSKLDVTSVGL